MRARGAETGERVPAFGLRAALGAAGRLGSVGGRLAVRAGALAMVVGAGVGGCYGANEDARPTVMPAEVCSSEWWNGHIESGSGANLPASGIDVNTRCDAEGNTPVHLALRREGVFTEPEFNAVASVVRAGADLFADSKDGATAVTLAEERFQRLLARWDRDLEKLCDGVDVLDEAVERERWENSLYYLIRTDSGLEALEEVRARTNARRERLPSCAR